MEVKPEPVNGTPVAKAEIIPTNSQGGGGPPNNFNKAKFQQGPGGPGGPNVNKKKNFQNRGDNKGMGNNNMPRNNNRGPMKNEVRRKFNFSDLACSAAIFGKNRK